MTLATYIQGIIDGTAWEFNSETLDSICFKRGVDPNMELDLINNPSDVKTSELVEADYYLVLSVHASYSAEMDADGGGWKHQGKGFEANERTKKSLEALANKIYKKYGMAIIGDSPKSISNKR